MCPHIYYATYGLVDKFYCRQVLLLRISCEAHTLKINDMFQESREERSKIKKEEQEVPEGPNVYLLIHL